MVDHLERHNANVARAMHQLGAESTEAFEDGARQGRGVHRRARARRGDLHQERLRGAQPGGQHARLGRGPLQVGEGDEVVITEMEHHSNIVPWQLLTERTGATLRWFGLTDDGRLDLSNIDELITERTKVVSLTWVSNMLGTINPVAEIARRAHEVGAIVVVDASQAAPQLPVDVVADAAPTSWPSPATRSSARPASACSGAGASCSTQLPPFLGGGEMIETVRMERSTYAGDPAQVRGRHPADRRGGRARCRGRLPRPHRAWTTSTRTSRRSPATRSRAWPRSPG